MNVTSKLIGLQLLLIVLLLICQNKTDLMTIQEVNAAIEKGYEKQDLKNMIETIANDYAAMYNSAPNPIKDVLNQLLMFGEGEGVLVTTAIKQLWEVNQEYKEENK